MLKYYKKKCFGYLKENSFSWKIWKHVSLKKENNVFLLDKRRKSLIWNKQEIFLVKTNIFFLREFFREKIIFNWKLKVSRTR